MDFAVLQHQQKASPPLRASVCSLNLTSSHRFSANRRTVVLLLNLHPSRQTPARRAISSGGTRVPRWFSSAYRTGSASRSGCRNLARTSFAVFPNRRRHSAWFPHRGLVVGLGWHGGGDAFSDAILERAGVADGDAEAFALDEEVLVVGGGGGGS
jgi:hypothetical protein